MHSEIKDESGLLTKLGVSCCAASVARVCCKLKNFQTLRATISKRVH